MILYSSRYQNRNHARWVWATKEKKERKYENKIYWKEIMETTFKLRNTLNLEAHLLQTGSIHLMP
jgi:hypothetical protein